MWRGNLGTLEKVIKRLLDEARLLLESTEVDADAGQVLIEKLRDCAEAASAVQYPYSAHCLKQAASLIKGRVEAAKVA